MNSPYDDSFGIQYQDGTIEIERRVFNKTVLKTKLHIVKDGENLLDIAYTYYKDKGAWHIIADYNNLQDILEEVYVGKELLIPIL